MCALRTVRMANMYFVSLWYRRCRHNLQAISFYSSFFKNNNLKFVVIRTNKRINV